MSIRQKTPTEQIQSTLEEKGYRELSFYPTRRGDFIVGFHIYTNGATVLILQEHKTGGCELYKPVVDSLGIKETIEAIP